MEAKELKTMAAEFFAQWAAEEKQKVKIAFFGQPGAGKSSLINELVGVTIAKVSNATDTTKAAQVVEYHGAVYVDLPGYDTSAFPANEYFERFNPRQYDLFICVFSGKLQRADTEFFRLLQKEQRPCLFVRNKADSIYDEDKTLAEAKADIVSDVKEQVGEAAVLFTSCKKTLPIGQRGITELQTKIAQNLEPALEDRFIRSARAYTTELLEKKRAMCQRHLHKAMLQGAVNGLNPLLGTDVIIDAEILKLMYGRVREVFEITEGEIAAHEMRNKVVILIAQGLKKEFIIQGLWAALGKKLEKELAKYIPVVGQAAAMGVGASAVYYLGNQYIEACYTYAKERLAKELAGGWK